MRDSKKSQFLMENATLGFQSAISWRTKHAEVYVLKIRNVLLSRSLYPSRCDTLIQEYSENYEKKKTSSSFLFKKTFVPPSF